MLLSNYYDYLKKLLYHPLNFLRLDEQIVLEVSQQSKLGDKGKEALSHANETVFVC